MVRYFLMPLLLFPSWLVAQTPVDTAKAAAAPAARPLPAAPASATITAEQWASPRRGRSVVKFPGLAALVEAAEREPAGRLVLRHAGGDEGALWAEELRSWLVALGLPSARLRLAADLPQADQLMIELRKDPAR